MNATPTTVSTAPAARPSAMVVCTVRCSAASSPAPKCRAISFFTPAPQAYPVDKAGQQENQAARRAHGGKRFAADKVADNQRVNGIVQLLEQVAHEDRHRKQQHPFYD